MHRFRQALRLFGVTEQQWRVLRALSSVEKIEVTDLAVATCLLPPSLSRILRDLEERGLLAKTPVKEDLRRTVVSITPSGLLLIDTMAPYSEEIYAQITDAYGRERLELLQSLLKELVQEMEKLPPVEYGAGNRGADLAQSKAQPLGGRPISRG